MNEHQASISSQYDYTGYGMTHILTDYIIFHTYH